MYLLNSYLGLGRNRLKTPLFSECKDNFLKYKINNFLIKKYSLFAVLSVKVVLFQKMWGKQKKPSGSRMAVYGKSFC
jgi:hypothetical protein